MDLLECMDHKAKMDLLELKGHRDLLVAQDTTGSDQSRAIVG